MVDKPKIDCNSSVARDFALRQRGRRYQTMSWPPLWLAATHWFLRLESANECEEPHHWELRVRDCDLRARWHTHARESIRGLFSVAKSVSLPPTTTTTFTHDNYTLPKLIISPDLSFWGRRRRGSYLDIGEDAPHSTPLGNFGFVLTVTYECLMNDWVMSKISVVGLEDWDLWLERILV